MLSKTLNEVPGVSSSFSLLFTYTDTQGQWDNAWGKKQDFYSKKGRLTFQSSPQHKCAASHLISLERDSVFKGSEELPGDSAVLSCWVKEKRRWESSSRRSWHCAHSARKGTRHLFAHVLYFQRQPGFSSLLEAVAWPRAARGRGPPAGLDCVGLGSAPWEFMPQSTVQGTPSVLCLPSIAYISLWNGIRTTPSGSGPAEFPATQGTKELSLSYQLRSDLITATFPALWPAASHWAPLCFNCLLSKLE